MHGNAKADRSSFRVSESRSLLPVLKTGVGLAILEPLATDAGLLTAEPLSNTDMRLLGH